MDNRGVDMNGWASVCVCVCVCKAVNKEREDPWMT